MSFNGSGTFVINTAGQPVVANTVISATVFNALTADLATGLSTCITKDGQTTITANIPFGSNKITGLGAATAATDAATFGQVQSTAAKLITVTGTDTITGTMSPALTAYAAGQLFYFIANAANTGAMTINIDGLGAKAITRDGSTALIAGDVNTGEIVVICYDGTRFQMINAANSFGNTTINGTLTVTGNTGLQANVSITSTLSVGGTFAVTGAATLGSTLSVTGKSDLPVVSTASMNAAVAVITTGTVTNLTSTSASIASMNAGVALLTNATVTTLTATGASIASANIGNLQFTAASIASINAGVAVITSLTATGASIASMNAGVALLTTATVTSLTATGASIASANAGNLQVTGASVASANVGVALITTGTVTALTATGASIASANVGTAVVTGLTVTNASIASANAGTATLSGNLTLNGGTANGVLYLNGSKVATSGSALTFDGTNFATTGNIGAGSTTIYDGGGFGRVVSIYGSAAAAVSLVNANRQYQLGVTGANAFGIYDHTAGSYRYQIDTSGNNIWTISSEQMRLTSTGLGIGTSSPAYKLDVNGSARASGLTANSSAILAGASQTTVDFLPGTAGRVIAWGPNASTAGTLYLGTVSSDASVGSTSAVVLNPSGNLGLGVTPSAWGSNWKTIQIGQRANFVSGPATQPMVVYNAYHDNTNFKYIASSVQASYYEQTAGTHVWFNAPSGTAGNAITFTQAMTLFASGALWVGSSSELVSGQGIVGLNGASGTALGPVLGFAQNGTIIGGIGQYSRITGSGTSQDIFIQSQGSSNNVGINANPASAYIYFQTQGTERARITAGGYFKASNDGVYVGSTGSYHELRSTANETGVIVQLTNATLNQSVNGIQVNYSGASPNGTSAAFLYCNDSTTLRASIRSNGGLANYQANNVDLSDARTKKEINPAASMWDKIGALEIVTYKYNDQTHDDVNVGVIAQQVESVEPVWVDSDGFGETPEDGVPLKTVYTKDITFAAIKALQEAMARIEQLEAKVAALETK